MHKKDNTQSVWSAYFSYYSDKMGTLYGSLFLAIVQSFALIPSTYFVQQIFDIGLPTKDLRLILIYSCLVVLLIILNQALWLWGRKLILKITKEVIETIRITLVDGLLHTAYAPFQSFSKNELHNQIVNDSERIDRMSNALVAIFIPSIISCLCLLAVLFYLNWILSMTLLLLGPTLWALMKLLRKGIRENTTNSNRNFEKFSSQVRFVIQFFDLIKSSVQEQTESQKKSATINKLKTSSRSMAWQHALFRSLQDVIISCISLLILVVGCYLVIQDQLSFGTLMSFYFVLYLLRRFMFNLSQSIPEILSGKESLESIIKLISKIKAAKESTEGMLIDFRQVIELRDVCFQYASQSNLLSNVNLQIQKGKTYAIIGSNGIGKSTLVKLLMRFYPLNEGQILIDGHSHTSIDLNHWRKQIGLIFQESYILNKSVRENILYGYDDPVSEKEIKQIIELSTLDTIISQLPNGIDTPLHTNINLSGGEKQKISIARALISQPNLLILDEPTNHLDTQSLKQLYINLKNLWFKPAILIITHNKDFLELADEVFELKNGRLSKFDLK
ncbi:ABC transporter ATP-binding protein/permease [Reichenbachiella carrageenanivorans]|uniref:ABC transporter ATP-binding protein/permease n=1 Tax=Reichenbachiella carrageenanivorans TaxID=2979869 RepID=A0ABY6D3T0_9BACT|nr:ABC transporter ATP-binding protein [Reichenbachiella carrageenanivorans]UXX80819.1 ABC transporter ATP-binding protein/permease [Reichenbachiella carrageenanivorans]